MKARGLRYTPHYTQAFMGHRRRDLLDAEAGVYRYDQLVVLKETRMPAVLLEAGSIINRDEELLLMTPERQSVISAAVTDAVKAFCASRAPRPPAGGAPSAAVTCRDESDGPASRGAAGQRAPVPMTTRSVRSQHMSAAAQLGCFFFLAVDPVPMQASMSSARARPPIRGLRA